MTLKQKLAYLAATAIPIYLWAKLIQHYLNHKRQLQEKKIAHSKHNCVVTYSKGGMHGWPSYPNRMPLDLDSYVKFLEPVIYFIDTADNRLDIAVMILSCKSILDAITRAAERGVKVRILLDAGYDDTKPRINVLAKKGVKIMYDQKFMNMCTMMHYKYAVKDFNAANGSGFTLCGSMNWTQSAFSENYEFIVLSTNRQVVSSFNKNFDETWEFLQNVKDTNLLSEAIYQL